MKTSQIVASTIETAHTEDPTKIALIASTKDEAVEVVIETMQAPVIAACLLLESQDAAKRLSPRIAAFELSRNINPSIEKLPEAVSIALAADGDVLCINVGSGVIFFKLTETAKQELKDL